MFGVVEQVTSQVVLQNIDKGLLASREEILADATPCVIIAIVGNLLLVIAPTIAFHHGSGVFVAVVLENIHHILMVGTIGVSHFAGFAVGVLFDGVEHRLATANLENAVYLIE